MPDMGSGDAASVPAAYDVGGGSPLAGRDGIVCDLDGVVYRGGEAVPHAVEALEAARAAGVGIVYATNNGSRPPEDVGTHLRELGLTIGEDSVVTSAQAAARRLVAELGEGAPVLAVGGPGVPLAIERAGLTVVTVEESAAGREVRGVLQSYGKGNAWTDLAEIAYAVNAGALWVASNDDLTIPTDRGVAPGNGTLVAAVRAAVTVDPIVVGKPETPLYEVAEEVLGSGPDRTLAIGDRLDTDIEGAVKAGIDGLFVMTGVHGPADLAACDPAYRPRYLAMDLRALTEPYAEAETSREGDSYVGRCGGAEARVGADGVRVVGGAPNERLRAVVAACWAAHDAGRPADHEALTALDREFDA